MPDKTSLLAANAAFYEAFTTGNLGEMTQLWADGDDISCIHPGWPVIVGRMAVIGSWRDILRNPGRPRIVCRDPYPIASGDEGRVLCVERIDSSALAASNHFKRIAGVWRLVHHQSSPIAPQAAPERPPSSRQLH